MKGVIKKTAMVLLAVVTVLVLFVGIYAIFSTFGGVQNPQPNNINVRLSTQDTSEDFPTPHTPVREDMLEQALQSVVGISSADSQQASSGSNASWYMGSGVLATEDGYIITNHHVIGARPQRIVVTLHNGSVTEGKTVWSDATLDLAVVKIDGKGYTYSNLGDAKKLRVGESVVAIGNPLSMQFQRTVTAGIISALARSISIETDSGETAYMEDLIQTDASINPGNSGGPLLNEKGEVVGINTVKVSTAEGMGFAVPINVCVPIIERLRSVGQFRTPYLGLYAYTPAAARYLGESDSMEKGLFVAKLDTQGPAFAAGIRFGDIITAINQTEVSTMLMLREELYKRQSGETVQIEFVRDGSTRRVDVMLASVK